MNKIYGDWRYDEMGNLLKPFNMRNERKRMADKWIDTFLTKVNKPTQSEYEEKKKRRMEREALKNQEKAKILNQILSADPEYVVKRSYDSVEYKKRNDVLISKKEQQTDLIIHSKPRLIDKMNKKSRSNQDTQIMIDPHDLDLVGFVE